MTPDVVVQAAPMSAEWETLIETWGYWLMAFGAIIEGETFLIIGGIAAAHDMLHLPGLILLAIVGCIIHDAFFFYLGRFFGRQIVERFPKTQSKIEKVTRLLEKYDAGLIIAFRFMYGVRTIIPFALGISKISNFKFMFFDAIGAIIWSAFFIIGGYYFGQGLIILIQKLNLGPLIRENWLLSAIILILFIFLVYFLIIWYKNRRKYKKQLQLELDKANAEAHEILQGELEKKQTTEAEHASKSASQQIDAAANNQVDVKGK
ncbi:DedA family protein [Thiotrichales bacterium 19S3-7]|nr:DedA family protein [Thiotrichales bacterium 19S3-7]MCF6801960.1 DedA family protein [Thiotrichales bacterium 19S3-11]